MGGITGSLALGGATLFVDLLKLASSENHTVSYGNDALPEIVVFHPVSSENPRVENSNLSACRARGTVENGGEKTTARYGMDIP